MSFAIVDRAADEYILRYLDEFFSSSPGVARGPLLRVFDVDRRIETVSPVVQKYCLQDRKQFAFPTRSDILKHRVIITTLVTSLALTDLDVKGSFTHIFVDEAAQVCSV